jgi:hypothetical protein
LKETYLYNYLDQKINNHEKGFELLIQSYNHSSGFGRIDPDLNFDIGRVYLKYNEMDKCIYYFKNTLFLRPKYILLKPIISDIILNYKNISKEVSQKFLLLDNWD